MSKMVSNAELQKLITQFKDDFKLRCDAQDANNKVLVEKLDNFNASLERIDKRLDSVDQRLIDVEGSHRDFSQKIVDVEEKLGNVEGKIEEGLNSALQRISQLEMELQRLQEVVLPEQTRQFRLETNSLKEELESRTNRQMRRTLVFKNIPETKDDESFAEVKELLADIISSSTEIGKEEAFSCIERAHREAKRDGGFRQGKRKIFAAFLNWELPQRILDEFRKKNIADRSFKIYAEQMYGPLTTQRRNMAFELRKRLKEEGHITSGYVAFPAKLLVNRAGDVDVDGKKNYRLHTNFSFHEVVKNNDSL